MPLRVRRGADEMTLAGNSVLALLYRRRELRPDDLVWHPARSRWIRVDEFLFVAGNGASDPPGTGRGAQPLPPAAVHDSPAPRLPRPPRLLPPRSGSAGAPPA
ncbi:MAG: hypothetical protein ABR599_01890 [Gemmatimonadota bacterium]